MEFNLSDREKLGLELIYIKFGYLTAIEVIEIGDFTAQQKNEQLLYVNELHRENLRKQGINI